MPLFAETVFGEFVFMLVFMLFVLLLARRDERRK